MRFLISDERNPSSIVSCIRCARENSRTLREVLPRVAWERINSLYLMVNNRFGTGNRTHAPLQPARRTDRAAPVRHRPAVGLHEPRRRLPVHQARPLPRAGRHDHADTRHQRRGAGAAPASPPKIPRSRCCGWACSNRSTPIRCTAVTCRSMCAARKWWHYLLQGCPFPAHRALLPGEIEGCLSQLPHHLAPMKMLRVAHRRLQGMRIDQLTPAVAARIPRRGAIRPGAGA